MNVEVLKDLWIKEDTDWNVHEVFENQQQKKIEKFSQSYMNRKLKLMGHVIRADNEDPLRQVTFRQGNMKGARIEKRRARQSKFNWSWEGKNKYWRNSDMKSTNLRKMNRTKEGKTKES